MDLLPVTTPTVVEQAVEALLAARIQAFAAARRQQNMRYVFGNPAVTVAIYDGKFEVSGKKLYALCPLHVQLRFSNAKGEEERRDGINPLVVAVTKLLNGQRLGLKIQGLIPRNFKEVTTEKDFTDNLIVYDLEFFTKFELETEADPEEFLQIALQYYLQPNDGAQDAEDVVLV
jgi:phage gp37-like protein